MTDAFTDIIRFAETTHRPRDPIEWEETLPIRQSSPAWRAIIRGAYGTIRDPLEYQQFCKLSGGRPPPAGGSVELLVVGGRRGGKSDTIARVGVFEALFGGHERVLAPGQTGLIAVISPEKDQSQQILGYVRGLATLPQVIPYLAKDPGRNGVLFSTGIEIRVMTADAVSVSGPTLVMVIRDEWAKWPGSESVMPDTAIEASLRPALAPVVGAPPRRVVGITSAYIQEGLAYETDKSGYGNAESKVLVLHGNTDALNPNIDREWLAKEKEADAFAYAREYECEWQPAIVEGYFPPDVVKRSVDAGTKNREPDEAHVYYASVDQAFRGDQFALTIVHREQRPGMTPLTVVDGVWWWHAPKGKSLDVSETVAAAAAIINEYGAIAIADQFSFDPIKEEFQRHGVFIELRPWSSSTKPAKFAKTRALMTNGSLRLVDVPELVREFCNIRAKLLRSGGEQFEAREGHDDLAHATVAAVFEAVEKEPDDLAPVPEEKPEPGAADWHRQREEERFQQLSDEWEEAESGGQNDWILGPG